MQKIKQLQWQCRRGMLEVDILLKRYLNEVYEQASAEEQACFEVLLKENDQSLFEWLTGKSLPIPHFHSLIEKMRRHGMMAGSSD